MFKLLKYLKEYKKEAVLAPLFKMSEALLELFVPLIVSSLIDVGINGTGGKEYIVKMCLLLVLFGLAGLGLSVTAQYFAAKAAVGFTKQVRFRLFEHIQQMEYSKLDKIGTSTLMTRLTSDMNQVQNGMNLTLRLLLRSPFVVFGSMIMAFTVNSRLALIFAVAIPVLAIVVFSIMLACIPLYKKVQVQLDSLLGAARENLTGVRVIRAFCKEENEKKRFNERNEILTAGQVKVGKISALMNPVTYVVVNLAIAYLIYRGAISVEAGIVTQGALIALYNYMTQILVELIKLANLIINITRSIACGNRVEAVLEEDTGEIGGKETETDENAPAVEFDGVSLIYGDNREPSIENISFTVQKGQTVGIIGGTGSGKTSVVNMIPAFYPASSGTVKVFGKDVNDLDKDYLRSLCGVVPQKARLFKGTIRDNLLWGNENADDSALEKALEISQSKEIVAAKTDGLDSPVEQNGRNFSGGQKQRLCIARALVKQPKILILDDSASALDYATDLKLRRGIAELKDTTVFIVSQRTSSLKHADLILLLDDGHISASGTHEQLLENSPLYREIHYSSNKEETK